MRLSNEQIEVLEEDLRPVPPLRLLLPEILPRKRRGGPGFQYNEETGVYEPVPEPVPGPTPVPVPGPTPGPPPVIPGADEVETVPVQLYFFANTASVNGAEIGSFPGPARIKWISWSVTTNYVNNDHDTLLRVDFAPIAGRDSFTFVSSAHPTGSSSAPLTLFRYAVDYAGGGAGANIAKPGWFNLRIYANNDQRGNMPLNFLVDLPSFFIKVYFANDAGTTQGIAVNLVMARLNPAKIELVPPSNPVPIAPFPAPTPSTPPPIIPPVLVPPSPPRLPVPGPVRTPTPVTPTGPTTPVTPRGPTTPVTPRAPMPPLTPVLPRIVDTVYIKWQDPGIAASALLSALQSYRRDLAYQLGFVSPQLGFLDANTGGAVAQAVWEFLRERFPGRGFNVAQFADPY